MCPARSSYTTWIAASRWVAPVRVAVFGVRVLLSLWYSALRWTFLPFSIAPSATTFTFTVGPYSGCLSSASRFTHCLCGSPGGGQESLIGEILSTFASHSMPVFLLHFLSRGK